MRFRFARFIPFEPFVTDLDIGPAVEGCFGFCMCYRIPMHTLTNQSQVPNVLS